MNLVSVIKYRVEIHTGKEPGAEPDPDARCYIQMFGTRGDSGKRWLYQSLNNDEMFKEGQMDEFEIEAVSLDEIEEVLLGHDASGAGMEK